ncbi:terminase large subunit domain-containing protein [Fodinicurvata sediminis]|uniref:terminase large subunit domain-containing protein n=1 Tax=Fodinicurvata sediminis TaxID=1121832 RepID=UPI0034617333
MPSPGVSCMRTMQRARRLSGAQWCDAHIPGQSVEQWLRDAAHMPIFYPSDHPQLKGGDTIQAIVPLGLQPIIDAHVPVTNNYVAGGVTHHNSGKTFGLGGYEVACHLTGLYPHWWEGRRFEQPVSAWAAGDTYETTRDIIQLTLLGEIAYSGGGRKKMDGRGIVPGYLLGTPTWRSGVANLVDTIPVQHASGGTSHLALKSYDQGRKAFQGTGKHVIWLDEEPPLDVYNECLIRTATLNGITMLTFTPLSGLSEVVMSFMPANQRPDLAA